MNDIPQNEEREFILFSKIENIKSKLETNQSIPALEQVEVLELIKQEIEAEKEENEILKNHKIVKIGLNLIGILSVFSEDRKYQQKAIKIAKRGVRNIKINYDTLLENCELAYENLESKSLGIVISSYEEQKKYQQIVTEVMSTMASNLDSIEELEQQEELMKVSQENIVQYSKQMKKKLEEGVNNESRKK